jgi:hypothetical protein
MSTKRKDLTKTYSGIFGNQVVMKSKRGKLIMTIQPPKPVQRPSMKQLEWRRKFRAASNYAKNILKDPERLSFYTSKLRKGLTTYNLALKDILNPPSIQKIDTSGYHGNPGDKIRVTADDIFALVKVAIRIVDANRNMVEEGVCVFSLPTGTYDYSATKVVPDLSRVTVKVTARDMPGNETVKVAVME